MSEDWRVRIGLEDEGRVHGLVDALRDGQVTSQARKRLGGAVVISRDGREIFLYAGSQEDARNAEQVLRDVLGDRAPEASFERERWHEIEERWEPWSAPLPRTPDDVADEERRRDQQEALESEQAGSPLWEVRIELPERADAAALEKRLDGEGIRVVRRHSYILIGAPSEGEAEQLRRQLAGSVPADARLSVEGSVTAAELERPYGALVAVFGGLAQ